MYNLGNWLWNSIEKLMQLILKTLFKLIRRELTDETLGIFMQFIIFGFVGLSNTLLSYILYLVLFLIFQRYNFLPDSGYLVAQAIAFVISILWSFYWNDRVVFTLHEGEERAVLRTFVKTFISYSFTGLLLNSVLLIVWVKVLQLSEFIAPIINLLISVPLNFIINKFWAFKKSTKVQ